MLPLCSKLENCLSDHYQRQLLWLLLPIMCIPQLGDSLAISVLSITFYVFLIALHMHWPRTLSPLTFNTYLAALFGTFRFLCAYLLACMQPQMCIYYSTYVSDFITQLFVLHSVYLRESKLYDIFVRCVAVTDSKSFHQTTREVIPLSI